MESFEKIDTELRVHISDALGICRNRVAPGLNQSVLHFPEPSILNPKPLMVSKIAIGDFFRIAGP